MTGFHPASFIWGVIGGAVAMLVLYTWVLVTAHKRSKDLPAPQDWSRHAPE